VSRILVVDDDAGMLAAFRDLLGGQRHEVLTAQCAETALQQVEAAPPELVVMDVWLPGMDGMEAFRRLRAGHPRLPVIVMTGGGTTELAIEAAKLGAFDYLLKPFEPEALLGVIGQALASRQPKRAGAAGEADGRAPEDLQPAFFDYDSYSLRDDARTALDRNAKLLRDNPNVAITIEGHCDERGTVEYNQALGEKRTQAARDYLVVAGIDVGRVNLISYGKERPFATGQDETSWQQNRRAHFVVRATS
jgi:peptidoglycan-associated lipoprotein